MELGPKQTPRDLRSPTSQWNFAKNLRGQGKFAVTQMVDVWSYPSKYLKYKYKCMISGAARLVLSSLFRLSLVTRMQQKLGNRQGLPIQICNFASDETAFPLLSCLY
jgi:hypothetical protein